MSNRMTRWILLRGVGKDAFHWHDFPASLAQRSGSDEVIALDLPGSGRQCQSASPTRIDDAVHACRQQLLDCDVAMPVHLIGISMGGMIALRWQQLYPEELSHIALVNTSARPYCRVYQRIRLWRLAYLAVQSLGGTARRERAIMNVTTAMANRSDIILSDRIGHARRFPCSKLNLLRQLLAAARFRMDISESPRGRQAFIASRQDRLVDFRCSQRLARMLDAPLFIHPSAGHDLPVDDPDWLADRIVQWATQSTAPWAD